MAALSSGLKGASRVAWNARELHLEYRVPHLYSQAVKYAMVAVPCCLPGLLSSGIVCAADTFRHRLAGNAELHAGRKKRQARPQNLCPYYAGRPASGRNEDSRRIDDCGTHRAGQRTGCSVYLPAGFHA